MRTCAIRLLLLSEHVGLDVGVARGVYLVPRRLLCHNSMSRVVRPNVQIM